MVDQRQQPSLTQGRGSVLDVLWLPSGCCTLWPSVGQVTEWLSRANFGNSKRFLAVQQPKREKEESLGGDGEHL